jgi:hypothetical protein
MKRFRNVLLAFSVLIVLTVIVYWFTSYNPKEFRGAGPMKDDGFFSYYRYHAPVGYIPFAQSDTYKFQFSGLPSEIMVLQFYIPHHSTSNKELLENLSTTLNAKIVDASGNVICNAQGSPSANLREKKWVLMSSSTFAAYWHKNCDALFARNMDYTLHVTVNNIDSKTPNVMLKAMLEGGGNELP